MIGLFRTDRRRLQPAKASLDDVFTAWMSSDAEVIYTYVWHIASRTVVNQQHGANPWYHKTCPTWISEAAAYSTLPQLFTVVLEAEGMHASDKTYSIVNP